MIILTARVGSEATLAGVSELLEALDAASQRLEGSAPAAPLAELRRLVASAAAQIEGVTERVGAQAEREAAKAR